MLKFGDKVISNLYFNDKRISKAYMGSKLVYKEREPIFLDYIESTGTQYIDTGIEATSITRFVIKGTCETNGYSNAQLLGTQNNSASTFFGSRYMSSTGIKSWYCKNAESVSIGNPTNLSIIDCTIESRNSQYGTLTDLVDGSVNEFVNFTDDWGFTSGNLLLFGGISDRISPNATCHSLQLYTANGLVRDLRPCLHPKTLKVCMYDMVAKKYFYNKGAGSFVAGNKIKFVDYISFDGESWIDVEYIPSSNTRVVGKFSITAFKGNGANYIFGVFGDNANYGLNIGSNRQILNIPWASALAVAMNNPNNFNQIYSFDISKNGAYLDGILKLGASQLSATFTATKSFFVGWANGTSTDKLIGNVYPMQMYENETLVKDLRPCIINDVIGLYDMVAGKFHTNIGTGTLKASGRFVESIISDGNCYIDTGIKPSYYYTIKTKYMYTSFVSAYNCIFGTRSEAVSEGNKIYWVGYNSNNSEDLMLRMGKTTSSYTLKLNEVIDLEITPNEAIINGTNLGDAMFDGEIGFDSNIYLFNINNNNNGSTDLFASVARMYNFQIYNNNMELIQYLRPYVDEDGIPCFYDTVTNVKFYNEGTGTLSYTE